MSDIDLLGPLRSSIMDDPLTIDGLGEWKGEPAVFTRRPVPDDAPMPLILIEAALPISDMDGLNSDRPVAVHDIKIYGQKGAPGSEQDQTRTVERLGFALRRLFHRNRFSVQGDGFYAIDVSARGPGVAPTDDEQTVGRYVTVTIRLRRA